MILSHMIKFPYIPLLHLAYLTESFFKHPVTKMLFAFSFAIQEKQKRKTLSLNTPTQTMTMNLNVKEERKKVCVGDS